MAACAIAASIGLAAWAIPIFASQQEPPSFTLSPLRMGDIATYQDGHGKAVRFSVVDAGTSLDAAWWMRPSVSVLETDEHDERVLRIDPTSLETLRLEQAQTSDELAGDIHEVSFQAEPAWATSLLLWSGQDVDNPDLQATALHALPFGAWDSESAPKIRVLHGTMQDHRVAVLEGSTGGTTRQVWLSPHSPFPLAFIESTDTGTSKWVLDFEPGDQPLPEAPQGFQVATITPIESAYPRDDDADLPFTLSEAMAGLDADLSLVGYHTWRATHPDAALVGFRLLPTDITGSEGMLAHAHEWSLRFSDADGQSILVISLRNLETGAVIHKDAKQVRQIPPEMYAQRPTQFVTLGQASVAWKAFAAEAGLNPSPNAARWGYIGSCGHWVDGVACPVTVMRELQVGHHGAYAPGVPTMGGDWDHASLILDAANGSLLKARVTKGAAAGIEHYGDPLPPVVPSSVQPQEGTITTPPVDFEGRILVATAAGAFVLLVVFWRRLAGLAVWLAYSRILGPDALDHPTREHIAHFIQENPGVTPTQLKAAGLAPWSTLVYHLGRLEDCGLVRVVRSGRAKRYFVASMDPASANRHALQQEPRAQSILGAVNATPGASQAELAVTLGIRAPSLIRHLRRLEKAGLLDAMRQSGRVRYFARP